MATAVSTPLNVPRTNGNDANGTSPYQQPAEGSLYEVVKGERVENPGMAAYSAEVAGNLHLELGSFVRDHLLGKAAIEMLFAIPSPDDTEKQRRPDVAFVAKERWPIDKPFPNEDPAPIVPNLAVDVISPSDRVSNLNQKVREYFEAGVELVWVIDPGVARVFVYHSADDVKVVNRQGHLDGGSLLPGFILP